MACVFTVLPRLVGITKANDFVLTARIFECQSEATCGLFTEVVPAAVSTHPYRNLPVLLTSRSF